MTQGSHRLAIATKQQERHKTQMSYEEPKLKAQTAPVLLLGHLKARLCAQLKLSTGLITSIQKVRPVNWNVYTCMFWQYEFLTTYKALTLRPNSYRLVFSASQQERWKTQRSQWSMA